MLFMYPKTALLMVLDLLYLTWWTAGCITQVRVVYPSLLCTMHLIYL
jgi:hypothetical protein